VDEGQDFNLNWWNLLRRVHVEGGEMLMAEDATQDMYGRCRLWTDESRRGPGLRDPFSLEGSYRFPKDLIPYLRSFVERYLPDATSNLPSADERELFDRVRLRWVQLGPMRDAVSAVMNAAVEMAKVGPEFPVTWSELTLLVGTHDFGLRCVEALQGRGINVVHVFSKDQRSRKHLNQAFWTGDARLKGTTVHSFKGWESRALLVYISRATTRDDLSAAYVALSRLRHSQSGSPLTVVNSSPELDPYGQTWPLFERM
jgi:hypothetical protein